MDSFSDAQFEKYSSYIHDNFGINFKISKKEILESKLRKLMEKEEVYGYDEFFRLLNTCNNKKLISDLISEITVNKTDFFRESSHFDFIKSNTDLIMQNNSRIIRNREIRAWSAGCATGEEAYTLAMTLRESFPQYTVKILATDIDPMVLKKAMKGEYSENIRNDMEKCYLNKYFNKTASGLAVRDHVKRNITFRQFNLMNEFPFQHGFDIIFCRNVMIYFDIAMQQNLLTKFFHSLTRGGLLFLGHTEGITNSKLNYRYVQPAVYMK